MSYSDRCEFSEIIGKTIIKAENKNDKITFICSDGTTFKMFHDQDCCESVGVEDITGDLSDLYGSPILQASEDSNLDLTDAQKERERSAESFTWTFYTLRNINATVQIRWFGESNGYYSESVTIEKHGPTKENLEAVN